MYRIAYSGKHTLQGIAFKLSDQLIARDYTTQLVELNNGSVNSDQEFYLNILRNNIADIVCIGLPDIDLGLPEEIVIAALSERSDCFEKLIYKPEPGNLNPHIKLNDRAQVAVFSQRAQAIALDLFPSWQVSILNEADMNQSLLETYDGILNTCEKIAESGIEENKYAVFKFHAKEFIPQAAQNVVAFLCNSNNKELRKILSGIHITEVSQATNIERSVERNLVENDWKAVGVYCLVDHNYHYHVYASGISPMNDKFKRTRLSTATSENIAKNVLDLLSTND